MPSKHRMVCDFNPLGAERGIHECSIACLLVCSKHAESCQRKVRTLYRWNAIVGEELCFPEYTHIL